VASVAAGIYIAESTLHVGRRPVAHRAEFESIVEQQFHSKILDAAIPAPDGVALKAWYVQPQDFNGSSVILLHGVDDNRQGVVGYSRMFLQHGYAVLLPDARAHGESGGRIATYGVLERYDIRAWNQWLRQRSSNCTYLFGESMGAALALQAASVTNDLCAVAVEDPFSSLREIAYDRISQHLGVGPWFPRSFGRPAIDAAFLYARLRYQIDFSQSNPGDTFAASQVPALLIDGTADHNIPMRHAHAIMKSSASHAELWEIQGADHGGAVEVAPGEFNTRVLQWFASHHSQTR
jgi:hypothetical protein